MLTFTEFLLWTKYCGKHSTCITRGITPLCSNWGLRNLLIVREQEAGPRFKLRASEPRAYVLNCVPLVF